MDDQLQESGGFKVGDFVQTEPLPFAEPLQIIGFPEPGVASLEGLQEVVPVTRLVPIETSSDEEQANVDFASPPPTPTPLPPPSFLDDREYQAPAQATVIPDPADIATDDPKIVELVPNSGHQYFFIEIPDATQKKLGEARDGFRSKCIGNAAPWTSISEKGWARTRWCRPQKTRVYGVNVCLESNLGTTARGSFVRRDENFVTGVASRPYAYETLDDLPPPTEYDELEVIYEGTDGKDYVVAKLKVRWTPERANAPIEVDLIVDFGNTRTTAVLLEEPTVNVDVTLAAPQLVELIKPVRFLPRGESYSGIEGSGTSIIESWFLLQEPQFSAFEPPHIAEANLIADQTQGGQILRMPQTFVEGAPIVLGEEATEILQRPGLQSGRFMLSSPKRYAWDSLRTGTSRLNYWTMLPNEWSIHKAKGGPMPKLAANILRFMPDNGFDWEIDHPPWMWGVNHQPHAAPQAPMFPNGDALTWMALAVIEMAFRQINSSEYRKSGLPYVPRRLKSVQVTYPSGWIGPEKEAYEKKWQKAVNIFSACHVPDGVLPPKLELPLDEAVAAQLPIIYSEMTNMGDKGDNWIELMGRVRKGTTPSVRVLTVDIGGGTADFAVVEYEDKLPGPGVELNASLLFKDSSTTAGDAVVKELIEKVLLPKIGGDFLEKPELKSKFEDLFQRGFSGEEMKTTWKKITRLVLIPRVVRWLDDLSKGRDITKENKRKDGDWQEEMVDLLNAEGETVGIPNLYDEQGSIEVSKADIEDSIRETLRPFFEHLGVFISSFSVDLVIVCGKITEVPTVSELAEDTLPINAGRIITTKDFPIGSWYPFSVGGKIDDAKTVTATGVALFKAIKAQRVPGWAISHNPHASLSQYRNQWVQIFGGDGFGDDRYQVLLDSDAEEVTVEKMNPITIGRRLLPTGNAEQIYLLQAKPENADDPLFTKLRATIRRQTSEDSFVSEGLEIVAAEAMVDGGEFQPTDRVELKLCTLEGEEYWIDKARFSVMWDEEDEDDEEDEW